MHRKIGRFDAYAPDYDPYEVVKCVLAYSCENDETRLDSAPHELQKFFFDIKDKFPDLLKDFIFGHDREFPYSEQVEEVFIRLQEAGYVTRPNPSLYSYSVICLPKQTLPLSLQQNKKELESIAMSFKKQFIKERL